MRRMICLASVMLALCVGCSGVTEKESEEILQTQETEAVSEMDLHIEAEEELVAMYTQPVSDREAQILEECEIIMSDADIREDEKVLNFLVLITDEEEEEYLYDAQVNALMLLSLDKEERKMRLVSFERGMGVLIDSEDGQNQDDLMHCLYYGNERVLLDTIENNFKIDVNYFIRMNYSLIETLIDEMGGVKITLSEEEAKALNGEGISISETNQTMVAGVNSMDGSDALEYAFLHLTLDDTEFTGRQRNLVQAMINAVGDLSILQLKDTMLGLSYLVRKNIYREDAFKLVTYAPAVLGKSFDELNLPLEDSYGVTYSDRDTYIYAVDYMENVNALHEFLYE